MTEGSERDRCELGSLFKRKGSRGTPVKSLAVPDVWFENDVESEIVGKEGVYENDRLNPNEVGIGGSGFRVDDRISSYVRCGADEGAIVEGAIEGALYGFVEEKCWLAK